MGSDVKWFVDREFTEYAPGCAGVGMPAVRLKCADGRAHTLLGADLVAAADAIVAAMNRRAPSPAPGREAEFLALLAVVRDRYLLVPAAAITDRPEHEQRLQRHRDSCDALLALYRAALAREGE